MVKLQYLMKNSPHQNFSHCIESLILRFWWFASREKIFMYLDPIYILSRSASCLLLITGVLCLFNVQTFQISPDNSPCLIQSCCSGQRRTEPFTLRLPSWELTSCVGKNCIRIYKPNTDKETDAHTLPQ